MLSGHFIDDERLKYSHNLNTKLLEITTRFPYAGRLLALPVMLIDLTTGPIMRIAAIIENLARAIINSIGALFKRQDCSIRQSLNHLGNILIHLLAIPILIGQAVGSFFVMIISPEMQLLNRLEPSKKWMQIRNEITTFVTAHPDDLKQPESNEMAYAAFTNACENKQMNRKAEEAADNVTKEKIIQDWEEEEEVKYQTLFAFAEKGSKPLQALARCGELLETLNNSRTSIF